MNRRWFLLLAGLFLLTNLAYAQKQADCDCASENLKLPDSVKFEKALKDAAVITPVEKRFLKKLPNQNEKIIMMSLRGRKSDEKPLVCSELDEPNKSPAYKYVTLPSEISAVYQERKIEFSDKQDRLKKLLGLVPDYTYDCYEEFSISPNNLVRPTFNFDWEGNFQDDGYSFLNWWVKNEYPFTALGYTCDWYYGDGCRYGLSEFFIPQKSDASFVKACTVDEFLLNGKCPEKKNK